MCKILVVDDFVDDCLFLQTALELENYSVVIADSGWAAIDIVQEFRPDIILLDILLPDMIGFAVVERICKTPDLSMPRFVLTTASSVFKESEAMASGADAFIRKPFDSKHLLAIVEKFCTHKNTLQKVK